MNGTQPKLLDRLRAAVRLRHYSRRTENAYVMWVRRYILFHGKRHPAEMGAGEVNQFLSNLAVEESVAASTQNQALSALLFLYRHVLQQPLLWIDDVVRARRPERLPVVLTPEEVRAVLDCLKGTPRRKTCGQDSGVSGCRTRCTASTRMPIASGRGNGSFRLGADGGMTGTGQKAGIISTVRGPASRSRRGAQRRNHQAGDLSHVPPFLCHASPGAGPGHPNGTRTARTPRRLDDDDLHAAFTISRICVS
jgi:hypothetical protein